MHKFGICLGKLPKQKYLLQEFFCQSKVSYFTGLRIYIYRLVMTTNLRAATYYLSDNKWYALDFLKNVQKD